MFEHTYIGLYIGKFLIPYYGLFAIISSKLLFILVSWNDIDIKELKNISYLKNILNGGFVFYGGLIGH